MDIDIPSRNKKERPRRRVSTDIVVLWDPESSLAKGAIAMLRGQGHEPMVVRYLEKPPTPQELGGIADKLGLEPKMLLNTRDSLCVEMGLARSDDRTPMAWLELFCADPRLLRHPIVVRGDRAVIADPPERVLLLLM